MRPVEGGIEADAGDPLGQKSGVLPGCQTPAWSSTSEDRLSQLPICCPQIIVESLPRLLGQFELHRVAGLLLTNRRAINGIATRRNVVDLDSHHVAASQLAIDGEIEEGQISFTALDPQPGSN